MMMIYILVGVCKFLWCQIAERSTKAKTGNDHEKWRYSSQINPFPTKLFYLNFYHLKLCLATATHNFKWLITTQICYEVGANYSY